MKILILGGDGYLGWPTAMYLADKGHNVTVFDNFAKRRWEMELGVRPLMPISTLHQRVDKWNDLTNKKIHMVVGDLRNYGDIAYVLKKIIPEAIVHYGEQPSAPYSMLDYKRAAFTQNNNVIGNLNLLFAIKEICPDTHLVKLGTMGEYGTPNIDIEEGYIEIQHNGRKDLLPFPKQPGSFYHLSKVHDSHNITFACRIWQLRATDLNQGVVYGVETEQTKIDKTLATSFHYDAVFGTALNRFCVQAVMGIPLTLYGKGGQTRGFLNINDTLQCVEIAINNPANKGEFRVFNQFTEQFSVSQLAELVQKSAKELKIDVTIDHLENPRVESEEHYFNAKHTKLIDLGLKPRYLSDEIIDSMLETIIKYRNYLDEKIIFPKIDWRKASSIETKI